MTAGARPFQFSSWMDDSPALMGWLRWFRSKGVPAGIIRRTKKQPQLSVWKFGEEHGKEVGSSPIRPDYEVEASVCGFDGIFERHKTNTEVKRGLTGNAKKSGSSLAAGAS